MLAAWTAVLHVDLPPDPVRELRDPSRRGAWLPVVVVVLVEVPRQLRDGLRDLALGRVGACGDLDAARAVKELNEEVLLRSALKK